MIYTFENCRLDASLHTLECAGQTRHLRPKALQVCIYLLEHRDRVVSKDELIEQIWPGQFISESTLVSTVREVRQAMGDSGREQRIIQALHGYGYRFVAAVEASPRAPSVPDDQITVDTPEPTTDQPIADLSPSVVGSEPGLLNAGDDRRCPACQQPNRATARFCEACGQRLDAGTTLAGRGIEYAPSSFVGREAELAMLKTLLERTERGQGHTVGIAGAAGIGKSRLLAALCDDLRDKPLNTLEVRCQPSWTMVPFLPVRQLIRQYCQITETDTIEAITAKVSQHLREAGISPEERVDYIHYFLGLGSREAGERLALVRPATLRVRILATLRQMLLGRRQQTPLLMIIHDVHWLDDTSARWLSSLADGLADAPILLLTTYREGHQPAWMASPLSTEVALLSLSPQDSRRLVNAILPSAQLPDTLAQAVLAQAHGNPLSLELLTRFVAEHREDVARLTLPATLQEIITVRLNRLPEPAKRLLQTASVLGQHGAVSLLNRLWEGQHDLASQLAAMEGQGFCTLQTGSGESFFSFVHHLIHEAVYASLQPLERQHLHAAAAQALQERGAIHVDPTAHLSALHAVHSGQAAAAIRSLTDVAEQATGYFAHVEAIQVLQEAQPLVAALPLAEQQTCRLELLLRHAQSLVDMQRCQEARDLLLTQELERSHPQDPSLAARHALLLSQASSGLGLWDQAAEHASRALEVATTDQDEATMEQAYAVLAMACYGTGRPLSGIDYSHQRIALLQGPAASSRLAMAQIVLGLNALLLGDIATALEAASEAETLATSVGDTHLQTYASWLLGWSHATSGASEEGITACQRSLAHAVDPLNIALASGWLGYAYLEQGDPTAAIPKLEQAVQGMRQWRYARMEGLYTTFIAEALIAQDQLDMAHDRAQLAFTQCQAETYAFGMGWAQRALGRIAQATGALATARQHLSDALATFAALPARFELGRTHLALAVMDGAAGQRDAAVEHVTEAYQLFQTLHVEPYVQRAVGLAHDLDHSF